MGCLSSKTKIPEITSINDSQYIDHLVNAKFPFQNIVFEGAATNGLPSLGAYNVLYKSGILSNITKFAGTSSGSMIAAFAAVRIDPCDLIEHVIKYDFKSFQDDDFGIFRDINRFWNKYGLYKGDEYEDFVNNILRKSTEIDNITFKQAYDKYKTELNINGYDLNSLSTHIFNYKFTPNMRIAKAVRISSSIPGLFDTVSIGNNLYVDGGLVNNFMLDYFDKKNKPNMKTLGIMIQAPYETRDNTIQNKLHLVIKNPFDLFIAVQNAQLLEINRLRTRIIPKFYMRTISLTSSSRNINAMDMSNEEKITDIISGMQDCTKYLELFLNTGSFKKAA